MKFTKNEDGSATLDYETNQEVLMTAASRLMDLVSRLNISDERTALLFTKQNRDDLVVAILTTINDIMAKLEKVKSNEATLVEQHKKVAEFYRNDSHKYMRNMDLVFENLPPKTRDKISKLLREADKKEAGANKTI